MPNDKRKPFPYKQKLITCLATTVSCECNLLTYLLLRPLQVKIKNIYLFKILIKRHETYLKAGYAQIFSCCPKNLSCPKFGLQPPSPPRPVRLWLWTPDSTHPTRSERSVLLPLEQFILLHSNLLSSFWLLFSYSLNFFFLQRSSSSKQ